MKGTGAKRNVCPGSCVTTGAKFPVAPVESAPMICTLFKITFLGKWDECGERPFLWPLTSFPVSDNVEKMTFFAFPKVKWRHMTGMYMVQHPYTFCLSVPTGQGHPGAYLRLHIYKKH